MSELSVFRETDMYRLYLLAVDPTIPLSIRYDIVQQMQRQQMYNRIYSTRKQERKEARTVRANAAKLVVLHTRERRKRRRRNLLTDEHKMGNHL